MTSLWRRYGKFYGVSKLLQGPAAALRFRPMCVHVRHAPCGLRFGRAIESAHHQVKRFLLAIFGPGIPIQRDLNVGLLRLAHTTLSSELRLSPDRTQKTRAQRSTSFGIFSILTQESFFPDRF